MAEQFNPKVKDYFYVSDRIASLVDKEVDYWDTSLIKLEFHTASDTAEYTSHEAAELLGATEREVENFFVVHCCLSNHLRDLNGDKEYSSWEPNNGCLMVKYPKGVTEVYNASDIALLMKNTESANWSYPALVASWEEMRKRA
ncbi:hypothetical protein [Enterovibrio norvegicus]|uniref:hypothetical protein n=1 Tax=Enterovibrio norvegicus TaxID=188144 RepID=UPI0024B05971|nr:hypothetical protein [Enterovibrio norvegicus]